MSWKEIESKLSDNTVSPFMFGIDFSKAKCLLNDKNALWCNFNTGREKMEKFRSNEILRLCKRAKI